MLACPLHGLGDQTAAGVWHPHEKPKKANDPTVPPPLSTETESLFDQGFCTSLSRKYSTEAENFQMIAHDSMRRRMMV
jgi:hypothetical protein